MSAQQPYSQDEHAAAWAAYYAQQGYTPEQIYAATGYSYDQSSSSTTSYGGSGPSAGGYGPGTKGIGAPGAYQTISISTNGNGNAQAGGSGTHTPIGGGSGSSKVQAPIRQVFDTDIINQSSIYDPGAAQQLVKEGKAKPPPGKRETVIRKGNGRTWEDTSLIDWDPKWFRLFVGDTSNDVNERVLNEAFGKYPSYCKCKVIKDRLSLKSKYAFIAFKDPEDMLRAWKEMDGKYVGNRPIKLSKIKDDQYGSIQTTTVSGRKARTLDKLRKNRGKPLDGRPVPY